MFINLRKHIIKSLSAAHKIDIPDFEDYLDSDGWHNEKSESVQDIQNEYNLIVKSLDSTLRSLDEIIKKIQEQNINMDKKCTK